MPVARAAASALPRRPRRIAARLFATLWAPCLVAVLAVRLNHGRWLAPYHADRPRVDAFAWALPTGALGDDVHLCIGRADADSAERLQAGCTHGVVPLPDPGVDRLQVRV